ncbi:MAG: DUF1501 domain-containing protein [Fuerstiella sp.]|nr:DUF1501 domain-containing protein [Fuerstiella sp.]
MNPFSPCMLTRREILSRTGMGFGLLSLPFLDGSNARAAHSSDQQSDGSQHDREPFDLRRKSPHFPPRATSFIQLVQTGGPSQMDLFDSKPELNRRDGQVFEIDIHDFQMQSQANKLLGTPFRFQRHGECGMELSELIPHYSEIADDICLVRSMVSVHNNHTEAIVNLGTGKMFIGHPSLGAWFSYALGTENQDLPAYVVLRDPIGYATSGMLMVRSGWLPSVYSSTEFHSSGMPVHNLQPSVPLPDGMQRQRLALLERLNEAHLQKYPRESDLDARIRNYELAARMQLSATNVVDISSESQATQRLYGLDQPHTASYGTRCLMARRLVEAGVRFVQVFVGRGQPWDHHNKLNSGLKTMSAGDAPSAALIQDLRNRGLLDSTIVFWAGEFGRMPVAQGDGGNGRDGRDHNKNAGSCWIAGGGFRSGHVYGSTDDVGYAADENPVTVPDLFATFAHQMGLDHTRVSHLHLGREENMTDSDVTGAYVHDGLIG